MAKRDLAGFDRALQFAEVALTKGPDIQLGTGAEGSGVGIIVDNQPTANSGEFVPPFIWAVVGHGSDGDANVYVLKGEREKRDVGEGPGPKRRAKVTTMYVKRGVPAGEFTVSECGVEWSAGKEG